MLSKTRFHKMSVPYNNITLNVTILLLLDNTIIYKDCYKSQENIISEYFS